MARGLGHGFYYSLTNSACVHCMLSCAGTTQTPTFSDFFLNEFGFNVKPPSTLLPRQANVTQQQFEDIAVASITELWTDFGERARGLHVSSVAFRLISPSIAAAHQGTSLRFGLTVVRRGAAGRYQ